MRAYIIIVALLLSACSHREQGYSDYKQHTFGTDAVALPPVYQSDTDVTAYTNAMASYILYLNRHYSTQLYPLRDTASISADASLYERCFIDKKDVFEYTDIETLPSGYWDSKSPPTTADTYAYLVELEKYTQHLHTLYLEDMDAYLHELQWYNRHCIKKI